MESKNLKVEFKVYEININKVDDYLQKGKIERLKLWITKVKD